MKKFICEFCGKKFKNKLALWGHYPHCKERNKKPEKEEKKEIDKELSIRELIYEINKSLAEIIGLLRRINENIEANSIKKRKESVE